MYPGRVQKTRFPGTRFASHPGLAFSVDIIHCPLPLPLPLARPPCLLTKFLPASCHFSPNLPRIRKPTSTFPTLGGLASPTRQPPTRLSETRRVSLLEFDEPFDLATAPFFTGHHRASHRSFKLDQHGATEPGAASAGEADDPRQDAAVYVMASPSTTAPRASSPPCRCPC